MTPVNQREHGKGRFGDCARAAWASMMDAAYEDVPDFCILNDQGHPDGELQTQEIRRWLWAVHRCRLIIFTFVEQSVVKDILDYMKYNSPKIYYLLGGRSPSGLGHLVVCLNDKVVHDPAPSNSGIVGPHEISDTTFPHFEIMMATSDAISYE